MWKMLDMLSVHLSQFQCVVSISLEGHQLRSSCMTHINEPTRNKFGAVEKAYSDQTAARE